MDEVTLRNSIKDLGDCLTSLHHRSDLFTLLVVIGVACEIIALIWLYRSELHNFRRGFIHPPEKPSVRLLVFEMVAVALVTGGIMGELLIGMRVQRVEEKLGLANEELVNAVESNAVSKAIELEKRLEQATQKGDATAARLEEEQRKARDLEAQLRTEFDNEDLELLATASGGMFDLDVFDALKQFTPDKPINVFVTVSTDDQLRARFARKLTVVLNGVPGWTASFGGRGGYAPAQEDNTGVTIFNKWGTRPIHASPGQPGSSKDWSFVDGNLQDKGTPKLDAKRLAILAWSLDAQLVRDPDLDEHSLRIVVTNAKK